MNFGSRHVQGPWLVCEAHLLLTFSVEHMRPAQTSVFLYFQISLKIQKSTHTPKCPNKKPKFTEWFGTASECTGSFKVCIRGCVYMGLLIIDHQHFTMEKCDPDNVSRFGPTLTLICHISKNRHSGSFGILRNMHLQELGPFRHIK